jgi:hypothetical protein
LFWLLARRHASAAVLLSRDVLLTLSALFVAVMTVFSARAMEARYIAAIGIALIPAVIESALQLAPKASAGQSRAAAGWRHHLPGDSDGLRRVLRRR